MHDEYPSITRLAVHLPDQQIVYFKAGDNLEKLERKKTETTLTAWFKINKIGEDVNALNILYPDFPKYYTWNNSKKQWAKRKNNESLTICRVYMSNPREG